MANLKKKMGHWLDKALDGTHHHFFCYLPNRIGWFSSWLLKLFYSGIPLDASETDILDNIPKDAVVVYVTKFKSKFEFLFYHTRYRQAGLPSPEIALDYRVVVWQPFSRILKVFLAHTHSLFQHFTFPDPFKGGYVREELCNGRSGFLSLVEKKGFYKWFVKSKTDPVRHLIEIQRSMDRPIYLVPQLFFFGKNPIPAIPSIIDALFGPEQRPGIIRRITTLFRTPEKIFMEISEPVNLKKFVEKAENRRQTIEHQSLLLRRNLLLQLNRHRQSITGPILKLREELKENILTSERLQSYMDQYAGKKNIQIKKVHKEAAGYIDEIAANYSMAFIRFAEFCVRQITRFMYEGTSVNHDMLYRIKSMSKKGPVIFIPCHKSHIDYLILSYIMYHSNMPCPHVAAGKNLSFWPMGPLFRGCGAFFIRRTFRGVVLYAKVFAEYIYKLLEEGFNIEFFIEGGRSRTGKLLMPKLGLLSILLTAFKDGACRDMIIAPVFIGYDHVLEESAYLNELEGGQKEPENLRQVIKARKFLKKRYGKIYIRFHEPISLNALLQDNEKPIHEMTHKEFNAFCRNLGMRALNAIDRVSVVTPHALVASAILNSAKKRFSYQHVVDQVETYMSYLFLQDVQMTDTLIHEPTHAISAVLESYVHRKFIESSAADSDDDPNNIEFTVNENKRPILEYYKNNCVSFFTPAAFTALSILARDAFQFTSTELQPGFRFLQEFFKNEFAADVDRAPEYFIRKSIKAFIEDAILMPHPTLPDTYNLTSGGFRKLKFYSRFVKSYFESYWIVLHYLKHTPQNSIESKERLKKIQSLGSRMYRNKEVEMKEALSKVNYKNAVDFFIEQGLRGAENKDQIEFYSQAVQTYLNCLET